MPDGTSDMNPPTPGTSTNDGLVVQEDAGDLRKIAALETFPGDVVHEFNNLLTLIKGHSELLAQTLPAEGDSREDIDQVLRAADRAAELVRGLLAFSRQQEGAAGGEKEHSLVIGQTVAGDLAPVAAGTFIHSETTRDARARRTPGEPRPARILLVEDEEAVRALTARVLKGQGYEVVEANDGLAALTILRNAEERVDLVLTDGVMPRVGGAILISALRSDWPRLPVVMISAYTDQDAAFKTAAEFRVPFLHKPYAIDELLRVVAETLAKSGGSA